VKFGPVPVAEALDAVCAHAVHAGDWRVKKGARFTPDDIAALTAGGVTEVVVARLAPDDMDEDAAAAHLAERVCGPGVEVARAFTGRANLHATCAGVLEVDSAAVDAFNATDEALTLATLASHKVVRAGDMVATVKIIPYAVPAALVADAAARSGPLVRMAPFTRTSVAVISTLLPGLAAKVVDKTLRVTAERLARAGAQISADIRVPHAADALTAALAAARAQGAECILVFGASAIADRGDVIPAALEAAGGVVERLGMPVDPGNLLLVGRLGDIPVLGAPGCARSPKENGFDWVLMRVLADIPVTSATIAGLGVGGLLGEIVTRPQPRAVPPDAPAPEAPVAAVVLAAGRGTRMGGPNKLLAAVNGVAVVRRVVMAALASRARPVVVVTGHDAAGVEAALRGLPVQLVHNEAYGAGMSGSVRAGIAAVPAESPGAILLLADMPLVDAGTLDALMAQFAPEQGRLVVVPVAEGRRGNPVLWSRRFFPELCALQGDIGARHLIAAHADAVCEVELDGEGIFLDVDTPDALAHAQAVAAS